MNNTPNKKTFFNRQSKAGTYTAVITLVVLAVLIAVNLVVSSLPSKYTVLDTSAVNMYSISETSEQSVKAIDEPITFYYITNPSVEDAQLTTFIERYTTLNSKLTLKKVDPTTHPTFLAQYTDAEVSDNSLIIESERRYKVVDYKEIYVEEFDYYTFMMTNGTSGYALHFAGENAITGALDYVTTDKLPTLYTLMGHGESAIPDSFAAQLADANIAVESLSLLTLTELPENADCVMLLAPTSDISTHEAELLGSYMEAGGHLFLLTDYHYSSSAFPNLASLTAHYGLQGESGIVMEGDSRSYYQYPHYILPTINDHEITSTLKSASYAFITSAHGLTVSDNVRSSLTVTPLFVTSDKSYLAPIEGDQISTVKPEGAIEQSYVLCAAAEEAVAGGTAKLVWLSGALMITDQTNQIVSGGNHAYLGEMVDWMCEREQVVRLPAITMEEPMLLVSDAAANICAVIITALIPVGIAVGGCIYWLKRRRR